MLARSIPTANASTLACPSSRGTANRSRTKLRTRAAAVLRRGWRIYWERRARRATLLILYSLDERTLHDIGINPSEIESCVYGQGGDRLRRYNERWPWRTER